VAVGEFASPDDWRERERLLWPRGIHVSRSSVPVLVALAGGRVLGTRAAGGPAHGIDRWLDPLLGPAEHPLAPGPTPAEAEALDDLAGLIAGQRMVKHRHA
jgi:thioredoxin-like negative regulator of GroEL